MPSSPPAAWYPDPGDASQYRYWDGRRWTEHLAPAVPQQPPFPPSPARNGKWNTPDTWAALGTMLVLMPVTMRVSDVAVEAGTSPWVVALVSAAIAVTAVVLFDNGSSKAKDGLLFGVYLSFTLAAVLATGQALDVWEGWVMIAVVVPLVAVQRLRRRSRERTPA